MPTNMNSKIIALIAGLALMGSLTACSVPESPKPNTAQPDAMKQGDAMKKDGDAMKGDAMKKDGDAMKKDGDAMKKDGDSMKR